MFSMGVAQTSEMEGDTAIASLLEQCRKDLGDTVPQAGWFMAGHDLELKDFLDALYQGYPDLLLIGGTTVKLRCPKRNLHEDGESTMTLSLPIEGDSDSQHSLVCRAQACGYIRLPLARSPAHLGIVARSEWDKLATTK